MYVSGSKTINYEMVLFYMDRYSINFIILEFTYRNFSVIQGAFQDPVQILVIGCNNDDLILGIDKEADINFRVSFDIICIINGI